MIEALSPESSSALCQTCGACCAYSRTWPRFTTEEDADLDRIPAKLVPERPEFTAYVHRLGERPALKRATEKDAKLQKEQEGG